MISTVDGGRGHVKLVSSCRCQTHGRPVVGAPSGGGGARDGQG
ncbi:hypothetical protein ES319_A10G065400v1 [Gossypium barbadense]|uniref:Uncharacterized protein n=1 Tax=Gossypium barbadense TaxID=3634 RepID=A0A5J5U035_GOSBA|nr:hypothetical protein ES319_A10G065400v1 [Gossypium barbadense]